jgi:hypothetical protein
MYEAHWRLRERALVQARYRWDICAAPIEELYASLECRRATA